MRALRGAGRFSTRFSATYDVGFFTAVAIVSGFAGRVFGADMVMVLSFAALASIYPFMLGSFVGQRLILRRLFPSDMLLPGDA
jgi:hypothetical protein